MTRFGQLTAERARAQAGETPELEETMQPLFEAIVKEIPPPLVFPDAPLQFLVTNIDYDEHKGRICIARVNAGTVTPGLQVSVCRSDTEACTSAKVTEVFTYKDFARQKVDSASAGDIVAVAGAPPSVAARPAEAGTAQAGTLSPRTSRRPGRREHRRHGVPRQRAQPAADDHGGGADGEHELPAQHVAVRGARGQVRHHAQHQGPPRARARAQPRPQGAPLCAGLLVLLSTTRALSAHVAQQAPRADVARRAPQVEAGATADEFVVKGRGMLHLGILVENMRREGYEFQARPLSAF